MIAGQLITWNTKTSIKEKYTNIKCPKEMLVKSDTQIQKRLHLNNL